jgi:sugar lactone lactonase YvrE
MSAVTGSGRWTYEMQEKWPPAGSFSFFGEPADVAVDAQDRVFLLMKSGHQFPNADPKSIDPPVIIYDADGNHLGSWNLKADVGRHAISVGPDGSVYCTGAATHDVKKFTPDGHLLLSIDMPSPRFSGKPFSRPTQVAVSPKSGDIFVSDGYANGRVHRFSPEGKLVYSWGEPGATHGQFVVPHAVVIDKDENIYIADRENHRIQVFTEKGKLLAVWPNIYRAAGLALDKEGFVYVAQMPPYTYIADAPGVGHEVRVYDQKGKLQARIGELTPGFAPGQFTAPHGIAIDSRGNLYVAEMPRSILGEEWTQQALAPQAGKPSHSYRSVVKLTRKRG